MNNPNKSILLLFPDLLLALSLPLPPPLLYLSLYISPPLSIPSPTLSLHSLSLSQSLFHFLSHSLFPFYLSPTLSSLSISIPLSLPSLSLSHSLFHSLFTLFLSPTLENSDSACTKIIGFYLIAFSRIIWILVKK